MPHVLTSFLTLHWAAAFALLAMVCVMGGDGGAAAAFGMLGVDLQHSGSLHAAGPSATALLSLAFAVCAVLFAWAFVSTIFSDPEAPGDGDDVIGMAFAAAAGLASLILLYGTVQAATGLYPVVAAHLAALLASYLAIHAERWAAIISASPTDGDISAAARIMALGAAHSSMLSRLSGRNGANYGEGR